MLAEQLTGMLHYFMVVEKPNFISCVYDCNYVFDITLEVLCAYVPSRSWERLNLCMRGVWRWLWSSVASSRRGEWKCGLPYASRQLFTNLLIQVCIMQWWKSFTSNGFQILIFLIHTQTAEFDPSTMTPFEKRRWKPANVLRSYSLTVCYMFHRSPLQVSFHTLHTYYSICTFCSFHLLCDCSDMPFFMFPVPCLWPLE